MSQFDTIYKTHYIKLFSVAVKMLQDGDAASDIVQDVFIYYYHKQNNGHEIKSLSNWLLRATINKCIDFANSKKKYSKIETINLSQSPEISLESDQTYAALQKALSRLRPNERALALLYSEGLSYKEMSDITGVAFTSVGKTLSRTLKKLSELLKELKYELHE